MTDCGLSSSVTPAAAAPGRGSASTLPAPPSPPQPMESMATELEDRCPICLDSWEEASYVLPCLHQFCYPCITRWVDSKPECPLCKRRVTSIVPPRSHPAVADTGRLPQCPTNTQPGCQQGLEPIFKRYGVRAYYYYHYYY
uniref:RING-type E3 ubiquitin transferase n=1 Tax=Melopsittacus undulatus TaxID=13146 RepID=A0A8V5H4U0_MELUD